MSSLETTSKTIGKAAERNSWKMKALKRAKLEAAKGVFISHQAMVEWVNSLATENELPAPDVDTFKTPNVIS
jgi:predicted transcriptional regulator